MRISAKRSLSLLNSVFNIEEENTLGFVLHPKFKTLLSVAAAQKSECYRTCRALLPKGNYASAFDGHNEPPRKKQKNFLEQSKDDDVIKAKCKNTTAAKDELDIYIDCKVDEHKNYANTLLFWKEYQDMFPNLSKLAHRIYFVLCSSAAVEREFSTVDLIVNQSRYNLDPTTVNNILFLRSIENGKKID